MAWRLFAKDDGTGGAGGRARSWGLRGDAEAIVDRAITTGVADQVFEVAHTAGIVAGGSPGMKIRELWKRPGSAVPTPDDREHRADRLRQLLQSNGIDARSADSRSSVRTERIQAAGANWVVGHERLRSTRAGCTMQTTYLRSATMATHVAKAPAGWVAAPLANQVNLVNVEVGFDAGKDRTVYVRCGSTPALVAEQTVALAAAQVGRPATAIPMTLARDLHDVASHFLFTGRTADAVRNVDRRPLESIDITIGRDAIPTLAAKLTEMGAKPIGPDGSPRSHGLTRTEAEQKLWTLGADDARPESIRVQTRAGRVDITVVSNARFREMFDSRERHGSDRAPLLLGPGTDTQEPVIDLTTRSTERSAATQGYGLAS